MLCCMWGNSNSIADTSTKNLDWLTLGSHARIRWRYSTNFAQLLLGSHLRAPSDVRRREVNGNYHIKTEDILSGFESQASKVMLQRQVKGYFCVYVNQSRAYRIDVWVETDQEDQTIKMNERRCDTNAQTMLAFSHRLSRLTWIGWKLSRLPKFDEKTRIFSYGVSATHGTTYYPDRFNISTLLVPDN